MSLPLRPALAAVLALSLTMPAPAEAGRQRKPEAPADLSLVAPDALLEQGVAALRANDPAAAAQSLSELASRQPRNAMAQALLGLSYQILADRDPQALDLALAGYDIAMRSEPGLYWPAAMAGRAAFDQGKYDEALAFFSRAVLLRPKDAPTLSAVAAAAYMSGDTALASLAAGRAAALDPGTHGENLRLAALAAAANGEAGTARRHLAALAASFPGVADGAAPRVEELIQTGAMDEFSSGTNDDAVTASAPDQISLDVAIILSQNTRRERTGLNLLDGLSLQYGSSRTATRTISSESGTRVGNSYQRVLTGSISIPQINYNLNLFNRGGQYYSVVARPQLTAYRGEQSEFFVGRTLKVAIGGVNAAILEQVDIGIELKVTPIEITPTGTRVRIEAGRSFLTSDPAGTFAEALTTFRQKVVATAEIGFGETLLLSGLNEAVEDRTFSKTPVLGDIPLLGNAFNERSAAQRRDSVMVLVTPARPMTAPGRPWARSEAAARLARLWSEVIDPMSNAEATAAALYRNRFFTRMQRGDVSNTFPATRPAAQQMISELLTPGAT
ncbi:secretion protein [Erythrobacter tepidarius]|uniref:secretion protein n=1 Tax=Erythrobacter tepidarius TaxID=60454 RepID=UPI0013025ACD|nr:secretion protein [Erythrobacter tepidarius]